MSLFKAQVERTTSKVPFMWTISAKTEAEAWKQAKAFVTGMVGLYRPETLVVRKVSE